MMDYKEAASGLDDVHNILEQVLDCLDEDDFRKKRIVGLQKDVATLAQECEDLDKEEDDKEDDNTQ